MEPDFEGTLEQCIQELSSTETGKQVFPYAGEAIIRKLGLDRVDWYLIMGLKIITHTARLFISTQRAKIDGFNLDFQRQKYL